MLEVAIKYNLEDFNLSVDLTAGPGLTALFGRSGSGKTTLINLLAGLEEPASGHISINGQVLFDSAVGINLPPEKRGIGYVFQDARLFPHLNVERNLTYGMKLAPPSRRRHNLKDIVSLLELAPLLKRRPATLSGGEKQRVAIGRALLSGPGMLLMDEPLASLDVMHKAEILPFIERLRDEAGIPIVYVSHSIDEVVRLADTMVVMNGGELAASGSVEDIMARLDLRPLTGRYEAGAVISATIKKHDLTYSLSELEFPAGSLFVPRAEAQPGEKVRLRIRARDVSLALERPRMTSVLNVFSGTVSEIETGGPESQADVLIDIGVPIIARITRRSIADLGLKPGQKVFAMVKAAAIDRNNLGLSPKKTGSSDAMDDPRGKSGR